MTMKPFGELTTRENALRIIESNIRPIERTERVRLANKEEKTSAGQSNAFQTTGGHP